MPRGYFAMIIPLIAANVMAVGLPESAKVISDASGYTYIFGDSFYPPAATPGAYKPPNIPASCGTAGRPISAGGNGVYPLPCSITYVQKTIAGSNSTVFVSYFSYSLSESLTSLDLDSDGNIYVTGRTFYPALATPGALHTAQGNVFVAKLAADGSSLLYAAVFGGENPDFPHAIRVDGAGDAWIAGETSSLAFPTVKPLQAAMTAGTQCGYQPYTQKCPTGFVAKLNASGTALLFSTYLGGSTTDVVLGLALDSSGAAYLTGQRASADFPFTPGAFSTDGGVFVSKIAADGSAMLFSTALGGSDAAATNARFSRYIDGIAWEAGTAIAAADDGNVVVVGTTHSTDFPVLNGQQPFWTDTLCNEGVSLGPTGVCASGFIAKITADGSGLVYSTPLGGHGYNALDTVLMDSAGNAYVGGTTTATDFPTTIGAFQPCNAATPFISQTSTVLTEFDAGGDLVYSTYFGGADAPASDWLGVDQSGEVYASGYISNGFVADPAKGAYPFQLHFPIDQTPAESPQFLARCVLNAARRTSGPIAFGSNLPGPVAPGEMLIILGSGLGPAQGVEAEPDAQGRYPTILAGTRVLFDGVPAPVLYAQYGQIKLVAPLALTGKATTEVQVEVQGQATSPVTFGVAARAAGMFTQNRSGNGQAYALNQDGTANSAYYPALRGTVVSFFLTGYLPDRSLADGQIATADTANPDNSINVFFGAPYQAATPAIYAGQASGFVNGVARVDVRIPDDAPTGAKVRTAVNGVTWGIVYNYISIQ